MTLDISETEDSLVLHCPADTCLIEEIQDRVCRKILALTADRGGMNSCLEEVSIALDEILSNAMTHAYRNSAVRGSVDAVVRVRDGEVSVVIDDYGDAGWIPGYREPSFKSAEEKLRPDGRGIFIAKKFMDRLETVRNEKGGTRVVMRKKLV